MHVVKELYLYYGGMKQAWQQSGPCHSLFGEAIHQGPFPSLYILAVSNPEEGGHVSLWDHEQAW